MPAGAREPRAKPLTPAEAASALLGAIESVLRAFPGSVVHGTEEHPAEATRCKGHVQTQTGRIPCGNIAYPSHGVLCTDYDEQGVFRGCRREGRANGYAGS